MYQAPLPLVVICRQKSRLVKDPGLEHSSQALPGFLRDSVCVKGFPGGSDGKESACNPRDLGSIPRSGRSPGEGNGKLLQRFCLENSMDGEAWRALVHGVTKS